MFQELEARGQRSCGFPDEDARALQVITDPSLRTRVSHSIAIEFVRRATRGVCGASQEGEERTEGTFSLTLLYHI